MVLFLYTETASENFLLSRFSANGGHAASAKVKNLNIFTVPEGWSEWEQWGACSKECGGGKRRRLRSCARRGTWDTSMAPTMGNYDAGQE